MALPETWIAQCRFPALVRQRCAPRPSSVTTRSRCFVAISRRTEGAEPEMATEWPGSMGAHDRLRA